MENFIIYITKASGLLILFYAAYHIFLRKETFFNSNRWFLLAGLVTSVVMPFIVYTKTVWVDPLPLQEMQAIDINDLMLLQQSITAQHQQAEKINWFDVAAGVYFAGVVFLILRFVYNLIVLKRLLKGQEVAHEGRYRLIDTTRVESPFSFFNYIVYNSAVLLSHELENILCHEKVHSRQKHSADMILGELLGIAFWFNPFAWLYKKSISQNLEFIADAGASKLITDRTLYQKTLLKITVQHKCTALTNHFYQSLIKKRIVMLNKKQSNKKNSWKYAVVLPALAAFMLIFQVKVVAQEKNPEKAVETVSYEKMKIALEITKDSKDEELEKEKDIFKKEFNADVVFSNISRNSNSEITGIKVTVNDTEQSKVFEVNGNEPIKPFTIQIEKGADKKNIVAISTSEISLYGDKRKIVNAYAITDDVEINIPEPVAPQAMITPPYPPNPVAVQRGSGSNIEIVNGDNKNALVIINGVEQKKGEAIKIPAGQSIASIKMLDKKEAKKKYGKQAKEGAVEIITKQQERITYRHRAPMVMQLDEMENAFVISPDMLNELEVFTDISAEMGAELAEKMKFFEGMGKFEVERINRAIQQGVKELEHNKIYIQRNAERMNGNRQRIDERRQEIESMRQELQGRLNEKREALEVRRRHIEERRKEIEEARKDIEEVKKDLDKELRELDKEKE